MKKKFLKLFLLIIYLFSGLSLTHIFAMEQCHENGCYNYKIEQSTYDSYYDNETCIKIDCVLTISDLSKFISKNVTYLTNVFGNKVYIALSDPYNIYKLSDYKIKISIPILTRPIKYHRFSDLYGVIVLLN